MNDGFNITIKTFVKIAAFVVVVYIIELLRYAEKNYNMGIWSLLHGDINVLFPQVLSLMGVCVIFAFVVASLVFDNLVVVKKLKWAGIVGDVISFAIMLIALGITVSMNAGVYSDQRDIAKAREKLVQDKAVVHAGGFIEDNQGVEYDYTNSYDALVNAYEKGNRVIEIDLFQVTDGIVCAHGSSDEIGKFGFDLEHETVSMEMFLNTKIYGEFTPMSIDMLVAFMREHEDLVIVTDVKGYNVDVCKILADNYSDLKDRFFIQMYHVDEFQTLWDMGFHHIIYTLYNANEEEKKPVSVYETCRIYDIMALTYWEGWMDDDEYSNVLQENIPKCEHTVNDVEVMKEDLANRIDVIYTDNVDNDWMRE